MSRRTLIRRSIGGGVALWLLELTAGTLGFLWPNLAGGFGGVIKIGTLSDLKLANGNLPIAEGFPAYVPDARAYIVLVDPNRQEFVPGDGHERRRHGPQRPAALPALPAPRLQPNPCLKNFWFECPCHGSRYDRLGIKADGVAVRAGAAVAWTGSRRASRTTARSASTPEDHPRAAARRARPAGTDPAKTPTGCI